MRNDVVTRQWLILQLLNRNKYRGITKIELSNECKVSLKTIERDISSLSISGFPIYDEKIPEEKNKVLYFLRDDYIFPMINFSACEVKFIYTLFILILPYANYFENNIIKTFEKIFSQINYFELDNIYKYHKHHQVKDNIISEATKTIFSNIIEGTIHSDVIRVRYKDSDKSKSLSLIPKLFYIKSEKVHIVGEDSRTNKEITLELDKIIDIIYKKEREKQNHKKKVNKTDYKFSTEIFYKPEDKEQYLAILKEFRDIDFDFSQLTNAITLFSHNKFLLKGCLHVLKSLS